MIPVPSIDPPPGAVEVQARAIHARYLRDNLPGITDPEILHDWDQLSAEGRQWLLGEANRLINVRAARPGKPDDVEALVRRLTGMTPDELRAAGAELHAQGKPTHPRQDDSGAWYDVPCDCRLEPVSSTQEEFAAAVETLRTAGPLLDRLVLGEAPEHRAARQRTDEERTAIGARTCCDDAAAGPDEDGTVLHTLGCRNRCAIAAPCLDSGGRPGTYPCGTTKGHDGDCWVPPAARGLAAAEVAR